MTETNELMAHAERVRRAEAEVAIAMGVTEAFIDRLVESFYARVREDALLGPIFGRVIDDWAPHLAKMKDFWSGVALRTGRYHGRPMPAHVAIGGLTPAHFEHWLGLFHATLQDISPNPAVTDYFIDRAQRIAQSLAMGVELHQARQRDIAAVA